MTNNKERELLLQKNLNYISLPFPNLSEMTNDDLRRRVKIFEKTFEDAFCEDEEDPEDDL